VGEGHGEVLGMKWWLRDMRRRVEKAEERARESEPGPEVTPFVRSLQRSEDVDADRRPPKWARPLAPRPKWMK